MAGWKSFVLLGAAHVAIVAAFVTGIRSGGATLAGAAALAGMSLIIACALAYNSKRQLEEIKTTSDAPEIRGAYVNAALMALAYLWGGVMLLAGYELSGLRWQHGWQYGAGMGVIGAGLGVLAWQFGRDQASRMAHRLAKLAYRAAQAQAAGAIVGLGFLLGSGKIFSTKPDWAANQVFLAGGVALIVLSLIAVRTHRILSTANGVAGKPAAAA